MSTEHNDTSPTTTASPRPPATKSKTIGPHKKSRLGCLECKKRRVKCDERRPQCRRCAVGGRSCGYASQRSQTRQDNSPHVDVVVSTTSSSLEPAPAGSTVASPWIDTGYQDPSALGLPDGFTVLHMRLLYHATTELASYMVLETDVRPVIEYALNTTLSAPYLLGQLLALSALHCSTQQPTSTAELQYHATDLQTRALSAFNSASDGTPERDPVPTFLFASLLGIHILRNCLAQRHSSAAAFVTDFVSYLHIHRGAGCVIDGRWDEIINSSLRPTLYMMRWMEATVIATAGTETNQLRDLLKTLPDQSSLSLMASLEALHCVQWMLDIKATVPPHSGRRVHVTLTWPLRVPDRYVECLHQRQPEALAVLAFYGASLHQQRDYWGFGDAGSRLVRLIVEHIGPFWSAALAWPREMVANAVVKGERESSG